MAFPANLITVESAEHFRALLSQDLERVSLINFWASWAEPCKLMNEVVAELARKNEKVLVLQVQAESLPEIAETFEVEAVPLFVILRGHALLDRIHGADAQKLTVAFTKHTRNGLVAQSKTDQAPSAPTDDGVEKETPEKLNERLRGLMNMSKVVLFMKGTPDAPRCGFSRQTVAILREQKVAFEHFDILRDDSVRQGLKVLNNWPTFPQIIVKGELVGGLDVLKEMVDSGELTEIIS